MKTKPLKICIICDEQSIHNQRWIRDLQSVGHEVLVFPTRNTAVYKKESGNKRLIPAERFRSFKQWIKMGLRIRYARQIRKKLLEMCPDILHAHFISDAGWIGAWTGFHPFIVTAHGSDVLVHPDELLPYRIGNAWTVKKADDVVMVANHLRDPLNTLGCPENRLHLIPNYADQRFLLSPEAISKKFKQKPKNPIILSMRRLSSVYNVETLLRAARIVVDTCPEAEVQIIDTGEELQKLKDLTRELNLEKQVHFLGRIAHEQLADKLQSAHFYVSTALSDGLSVASLEGITSGCLPILTDIPANRALIDQGFRGDLFPCKDHKALAKLILNRLDLFESLSSPVFQNTTIIQKKYTQAAVLDQMNTIYYAAISRVKETS